MLRLSQLAQLLGEAVSKQQAWSLLWQKQAAPGQHPCERQSQGREHSEGVGAGAMPLWGTVLKGSIQGAAFLLWGRPAVTCHAGVISDLAE